MASFLDFFRISSPSAAKVAPENTDKVWKRSRFQSFIAITFGYALYYVCRMSMGVMKQPLIDAGLLNATQLGIIGACLYWTYAVGKFVNGFLADGSNVKRFMATGLVLSAAANLIMGVLLILFWLHDTPESKGLPSIEELSGEETKKPAAQESAESAEARAAETRKIQKAVLRNSGVWILALSSAFMYMSRYAINEWGTIFLQETYEYDLKAAAAIIGINPIFGVLGTVFSGWLSDKVFKGDRKYPAFTAGVLEAISLYLFLFGNGSHFTLILSMVLFGIAIGVLISFLGGLMAIDLVPRKASGAALGIVGVASYAAAGLQNVVTGLLLDNNTVEVVNKLGETVTKHDFTYVSWFWLGAAVISFLLPMLNWRRKRQEI